MAIQNVAIIGASGTLGPAVLDALVSSKAFTVTVLARESSKATFPSASKTIRIPDDGGNEDQLAAALKGQDALVVTMPASRVEDTVRLANACLKARIQRMIPADFGSVDSTDARCVELVPLYGQKTESRAYLQKLALQHPSFSWTSLVNAHFFDWGLTNELLGFDLRSRKATIFDDGNTKFSASTLAHIGEAVTKILQKEDATKNKMLYMESVYTSQNELLAQLQRISGLKFDVTRENSEEYIEKLKPQVRQGDHDATERMVGVLGIKRADWHRNLANHQLDLSAVDLQEVVSQVWSSFAS